MNMNVNVKFSRTRRALLFFLVCLVVRSLIPLGMIYVHKSYLKYISVVLFAWSVGFMDAYLNGSKRDTGFFGGDKWWIKNNLVHAVMYLTSAVLAFQMNKKAYIPLVVDVVFSLVMYINNLIHS